MRFADLNPCLTMFSLPPPIRFLEDFSLTCGLFHTDAVTRMTLEPPPNEEKRKKREKEKESQQPKMIQGKMRSYMEKEGIRDQTDRKKCLSKLQMSEEEEEEKKNKKIDM